MITKSLKFTYNNYLLICENINKYNLKSKYNSTTIEKISISIYSKNDILNNELNIKKYFIFYCLTNLFPKVFYKNSKKIYIQNNFSLLKFFIELKNKKDLNAFSYYFFNELLKLKENMFIIKNKNQLIISFKIPLNLIKELTILENIIDIQFEQQLTIKFYLSKLKKKKFVNNIPFFWEILI